MTKGQSGGILVNPVPAKAVKDKWEINRDDVDLQDNKKLDTAGRFTVMKGVLSVAVKSCEKRVSEEVKQEFLAEAKILKQFNHPNIVRLIGMCTDRDPFLMGT